METTLNEYQRKAMSTCMDSCDNFAYMFIGMVGEVGEVASKVAKLIRKEKAMIAMNELIDMDDDNPETELPDDEKLAIIDECGDCLWFIAGLTKTLGFTLEEVAERNIAKLADRKKRGVIDGEGDKR